MGHRYPRGQSRGTLLSRGLPHPDPGHAAAAAPPRRPREWMQSERHPRSGKRGGVMTTRHDQQQAVRTEDNFLSPAAGYAVGALRIVIGWTFLWAFFDKLLAL